MRQLTSGKILLPFALAALLSACGGGGSSGIGGDSGGLGTLNVNIQPERVQGANVIVAGPSGVQNVRADQSLTLDAGQYVISAVGVRQHQPIVDDLVGTVDKSTVIIADGQSVTVTADYGQPQVGSGRLWLNSFRWPDPGS